MLLLTNSKLLTIEIQFLYFVSKYKNWIDWILALFIKKRIPQIPANYRPTLLTPSPNDRLVGVIMCSVYCSERPRHTESDANEEQGETV